MIREAPRESPVAKLPPGVIQIEPDEYDSLYPTYELERKAGESFQTCYETLHRDMATAAAMIYDACMAGQKFEREQRS